MEIVTGDLAAEMMKGKVNQMKTEVAKDNSFMIRFRSSIVLTTILIAIMVLGHYALFGALVIISLIGLMELYRAVGVHKTPLAFVGYIFGICWYGILLLEELYNPLINYMPIFVAVAVLVILAVYVLSFPKYNSEQITMVFFGIFYVAVTLSYIYRVRTGACGAYTVWLIFLGSWGADVSAYMVGRKIGKHKMAPVLSPKKSVEGLVGGIAGSALLGCVYALIFREQLSTEFTNPVLAFTVICAISSVISMIGDLSASAIKRNKNIKDYGKLIPGHGGILDRFDSVIFIAPIVYYLLNYMA